MCNVHVLQLLVLKWDASYLDKSEILSHYFVQVILGWNVFLYCQTAF